MRDGKRIFKEVVFFLAKTDQEKVALSDEHIGYAWMSFAKAREKLTYQNAKDLLVAANVRGVLDE